MKIPFEPEIFGLTINIHLILEYAAFIIAFRYYIHLKQQSNDAISSSNRLTIILGAAIGAFLGSRIIGFLENPLVLSTANLLTLLSLKTIMGGLFGGLLGVELTKKLIGETKSSGDLFTLPIIVGIFIGRLGCFLTGINEFTYGIETSFFTGMNLGDNTLRHPLALYEMLFLVILFIFLYTVRKAKDLPEGQLFKYFMIMYFGFRFFMEFLKPNEYFILELSTIQWLCVLCLLYYYKTILNLFKNAN